MEASTRLPIGVIHVGIDALATDSGHGRLASDRYQIAALTVWRSDRALKFRHDFRRIAVRNLERAGVSRSVAMGLVGMKTQSIYSRYAIKSKQDLKDGVAKLARLHQDDATLPRQVIPLRAAGGARAVTTRPGE